MLAVCIACVEAVLVCLGDRGRQFTETCSDAPPVVRLVQPTEPTKEDLAEDTEATGRRAIDFSLPSVTHDGVIRLRELRGKIVVLIFGSFSCDVFCKQAAELEQLYQEYKDRSAFLFVQIQEAGHDIPALDAALKDVPRKTADRRQRARRGMEELHLTIPAVTDNPNRAIEYAYGAFPEYIVILDRKGRCVADIGWGLPSGWDFDEICSELNKLLQTQSLAPSTATKPKTTD
jgi:hypothetical protein